MIENPLVSIVVVSYNSSKYILETLESIKDQTYRNLELIISDDCSTDNTVEIVQGWLKNNKHFFTNAQLVMNPKNMGVAPNANKGVESSQGEWIKLIAADDLLTKDCIEEYVGYVLNNKDLYIAIAGTYYFDTKIPSELFCFPVKLIDGNLTQQLKQMIKQGTIIDGPALFIERNMLVQLGGFDVKYPMAEDYPLVMKYLTNGFRVGIISKNLIKYRVHSGSVSRSNQQFSSSIMSAIEDLAIPQAKKHKMYLYWYHLYVSFWIAKNSHKSIWHKIGGYFMRSVDFVNYIKKLKFHIKNQSDIQSKIQ